MANKPDTFAGNKPDTFADTLAGTGTQYLDSDGVRIAYRTQAGETPGVVFLGGFRSDMCGTKAQTLARHCAQNHSAFTRFDYRGHGESEGRFDTATISDWLHDSLAVIDTCTRGRLVLVGSSMGGWLMLLVALARPDRIAALLGVATATDMTEALLWPGLDNQQQAELQRCGEIQVPDRYGEQPYTLRWPLIEDGRRHLLLADRIAIRCPVRLLHGSADRDVPWQLSQTLLEQLDAEDVQLRLVKNADHRFSGAADLALLLDTLSELRNGLE